MWKACLTMWLIVQAATVLADEPMAEREPAKKYSNNTQVTTALRPSADDPIPDVYWDTLVTDCVRLAIANFGNLGNSGFGFANMDFIGDCDTSDPGGSVYLYDGTPVIFGPDTSLSWAGYGSYLWPNRIQFVPEQYPPTAMQWLPTAPGYQALWSNRFLTSDSALVMTQTVISPSNPALCNSMIVAVALWTESGATHENLTVGYYWDWDLPSDSIVDNSSGLNLQAGVLWQRGREVPDLLGDSLECQDNDARFAGVTLIGHQFGRYGQFQENAPYGAYVGRFYDDFVIPQGEEVETLFGNMQSHAGFSAQPESVNEDLYTVITFSRDFDLGPTDTLIMVYAMSTIQNGTEQDLIDDITAAKQWYINTDPMLFPSCCELMGDVNSDGLVNLTDLTCLIGPIFLAWPNPCESWCKAAANTNGDAACSVTLTDATLLVNRLFVTFQPLASCDDFDNSLCE